MTESIFQRIAREAMASAPSPEEALERDKLLARAAREERLEAVRGVVTEDDFRRLVNDQLEETAALAAVRRWKDLRGKLARPISMLALLGQTGRGKTVAGAWLLADLGGYYLTGEELRRLMRSYGARDQEMLERLYRARCVIVDDLGTEQEPETAQSALFELVNRRMGLSRGWTVLTANLSKEVFVARYGERTTRRLEHQGLFVEVDGEDLRRAPV